MATYKIEVVETIKRYHEVIVKVDDDLTDKEVYFALGGVYYECNDLDECVDYLECDVDEISKVESINENTWGWSELDLNDVECMD